MAMGPIMPNPAGCRLADGQARRRPDLESRRLAPKSRPHAAISRPASGITPTRTQSPT